ncbi:pentapeptide repeat-containing protein [Massilia sp. CCM 8692]|uniref:Pentapeptide repeat-containing protein n=2 Tax=Massilia rubra TaxID=2607910 RepID=A0ABX0LFJ5_9BURK|nr:pentapeptide repeat-containing protein [Massilia rubra]
MVAGRDAGSGMLRKAMDKSEIEQLKKRWTTQQICQGEEALVGKSTFPFPVMDDGFVDLRGIAITQFIKNVTINSVDLSGAALERTGQFGMCKVEKVRFCFASLQTHLGKIFNSCDFTSANLSGAVLRGEFSKCDFSMANLTSAIGTEVRFVNCIFVKTNFRNRPLAPISVRPANTCSIRARVSAQKTSTWSVQNNLIPLLKSL